ncbi:flagellar motor switch protein FliN [Sphingomonas sp. ST-64]|uniref:Flagellar motor switch protein FliN n=1 Tax=Sphingomonas plantiphila TaxID=3163295 RepID=A0ABW8YQ09_9SPHN
MSENADPVPNQEIAPVADSEASPAFEEFGSDTPAVDPGRNGPLTAVNEVPVRVQAVLGRARVPVGELIRMKSGMVLELDRRVGEPVDVFVNNRLVARGEVMLVDHALGVTLTEIVRQDG